MKKVSLVSSVALLSLMASAAVAQPKPKDTEAIKSNFKKLGVHSETAKDTGRTEFAGK